MKLKPRVVSPLQICFLCSSVYSQTLGTKKNTSECDEFALPSKPWREESPSISAPGVWLKIELLPVKGKMIKDRPETRGNCSCGQMCAWWS